MAGQPFCGWVVLWPYTPEQPRRFTTLDDALAYWPDPGYYLPGKVVFEVLWQPWGPEGHLHHNPDLPEDQRNALVRRGAHGADFITLPNPMSYQAYEEQRLAKIAEKRAVAAEKKKAKTGYEDKNKEFFENIAKNREAKAGKRAAYARNKSYKKRTNP